MKSSIDFKTIFNILKKLALLNGIFLLVMTLIRVVFFVAFSGPQNINGMYWSCFQAFFLGFRFDLSTVAYMNTLVSLSFIILFFIDNKKHLIVWFKALRIYYTVMFAVIVFISAVDFGNFSYFKDHINVMIYGFFEDDTVALTKTVIDNHLFPYAVAGVLFVIVAIYLLSKKTLSLNIFEGSLVSDKIKLWKKISLVFVLIATNTLVCRGSLKMFPLSPIHAEISSNAFINKLSVNGLYALGEAIKAHKENSVNELVYMKKYNLKEAFATYLDMPLSEVDDKGYLKYLTHKTRINPQAEKLKPNVVVVIMESFGANLMRYDSKEFDLLGDMREHFQTGYVFNNFLPAGLITIHALETMMLNIVQRPNNLSVTQTKFAYQNYLSAATGPYKASGYKTMFIYGGSLRWRQLDTFLPKQGFDEIMGESYFSKDAEKNQWGIYDEYLYGNALKALKEPQGKPKFIMIMTTTNHPPYSVPSTYMPKSLLLPEALKKVMTSDETLAMKRFITYQYANQKAGEFVSAIKSSSLGKNTIVVVTGDHNFWDVFNYTEQEQFYRYSVPMYMYVPDSLKPKSVDTSVVGSHVDIMPTLYNLSLSDKEYISMGWNLFDKTKSKREVTSEGLIASNERVTLYNNSTGKELCYDWDSSNTGFLIKKDDEISSKKDLSYYNAAMTVAEYLINLSTTR